MERVNRLIPAELQMPPAPTEADIAELARDIEALGYMSGERTSVLKTAHVEHSPGSKESESSPRVCSRLDTRADEKMSKSHKSNGQDINHQVRSRGVVYTPDLPVYLPPSLPTSLGRTQPQSIE